ncbi:hypothetical protein BpHYR1_003832 [Brachionus plicatilis]|uniref:Uncharacterized protein n=1 Tax=Brachionus plicatilis TaxID=10195 RepID=A0A3M7RTI4_BRAPC|nr:hypothetical protein BpHYR1_003832 [Brachionus plicatilis]
MTKKTLLKYRFNSFYYQIIFLFVKKCFSQFSIRIYFYFETAFIKENHSLINRPNFHNSSSIKI